MNERRAGTALFVVRVTLGVAFLLHGLQKVFGVLGGPGLSGFAKYLDGLGVSIPEVTAYAVAFGELLSGVALILGCFHRIAAIVIVLVMLGAILHVHWPNGYFATKGGFEYPLALIAMALAVLLAGPGAYAYRVRVQKSSER